ncbi:plasma-membrane proton-efflux P-type ATPase [Candidatus Kaiserbacteria bacterium]|nr:plasma-membrane proton-efflux P-type ATPase [Candidatus Kaiserbacteria bacterium]MCB9811329.1 plasma-membrane proton-efflux P-type ATPase [Candidatus Nomurabacteria bacterium]
MKHDFAGLTTAEAKERQAKYGFNEIEEKTLSTWLKVLKKFISPIPLMIEFALVLSAIVGRWEDFSIILVLLVVNITVDVLQERKASKALAALTSAMAPTALALRDGKVQQLPARELVPGDVVKLAIGDIAPADLRLLEDTQLTVDQSAITGESLPVEVTRGDNILSSAIIQMGSAFAEVTATGTHTKIGESAHLVAKAEREEGSHFQTAILRIGRFLILVSIGVVVIASTVLILRGDPLLETLRFAIVLTIASIPVALPAVLSVTMAIGAATLARHKAIVSDFKAVEELAGVDHLCIDKTGTLTENAIKAYPPTLYNSFSEAELYVYAVVASEEECITAIEKALYAHAEKEGYLEHINDYEIESFTPFDPIRKTTEAQVRKDNTSIHVVMGAAQVVAELVTSTERATLRSDVDTYATDGFRTIAIAIKREGEEYQLVGLVPLMDPPRADSKEVLSDIRERGIVVKMLTGDNHAIASFIGAQLAIGKRVMEASKLPAIFARSFKEAHDDIVATDVFSEVVPADKYRIVESLQQNDHIVAMTGDGVNDAPALKKADVGIAVKGATAAAQKAADLVLLDSSLSVIRKAIDHARDTFARMQSYATFRISETIRIVFFVALCVVFFDFTPVSAAMIILLALLNDIPVLAISYDNVPRFAGPVRWRMKEMLIVASVLGFLGVISSFLLFSFLDISGVEIAVIQTIIFLKLDVAGHSTLYLTRTGRRHFWERPFPALKFFIPAFSSRLLGTAIAYFGIFMPAISFGTIALIWLYATVWFVFNDFVKVGTYKLIDRFSHPTVKPAKPLSNS